MIVVNLNDVVVPEGRQRREFSREKLDELKDSILRNGLFHPFTVERTGGKLVLRAGERRLIVLRELASAGHQIRVGDIIYEKGFAPAVDYGELNDLQRLEIEVEETCVRADFTWQERERAIAALHRLRQAQNPNHTISATAEELLGRRPEGSQITAVSEALILDKHLDDPEIAKAPNRKEALKRLKKKVEAAHRAKLVAKLGQAKLTHRLLRGDARELLAQLPVNSFDVIVTDPPYGIGAHGFGSMASTGHDYQDTATGWEQMMSWLPEELWRVAKPQAHAYIFCDFRRFERLATLMLLAGWTPFETPLIWDKCGNGMLPFPELGPRRTYECILYAHKGQRRVLAVHSDVIRIPPVKNLLHGAQKPVALYCNLLARSANPGDSVLDCFGGTGPILIAANIMRLVATYIEQDENAYNIALQRAHEASLDDGAQEQDGIQVEL